MLRTKDIEYRIHHANAKAVIAFEPYTEQFDKVGNLQDILQFVIGMHMNLGRTYLKK